MIYVFLKLSFKPAFSLSSFTLIKSLFCPSSLSVIRVVSSAYLRLLMLLPPILMPAYNSPSLAFLMICSAYRLNKQVTADSPVILLSQSWTNQLCSIQGSNCCFLTHIQVPQEVGKMVWYSHLSKSFPQCVMIHTVKGFSMVDEIEIDVFLKFPCFLYNPVNVSNLTSSSSSFSKPAWTFGSSWFA